MTLTCFGKAQLPSYAVKLLGLRFTRVLLYVLFFFRHMHGFSDHQSIFFSTLFKKKNMILHYKTFDLSSQKDVVCSVWLILAGCKFCS